MSAESTANQQEPVENREASAAKSAEQAKSSRKQKKQRFYKRFKIVFSREGYLDSVPCYKLRKLVRAPKEPKIPKLEPFPIWLKIGF